MPTAPTCSRDQPTAAAIVMLRSISHASHVCIFNPSLPHLKNPQFTKFRTRKIFDLQKNKNYRKPIYQIGSMTDVLQILGPFDHIFPSLDSDFFVGLLRKCIRSKDASLGIGIHAHLIRSGLGEELLVSNVLLDMYAKVGSLNSCIKLFDEMPSRDLISWCTLISGCVSRGCDLEAYSLFNRMLQSALRPNHFVISSVLKGCSAAGILELGVLVHSLVIKTGVGFDSFIEIGLVDMYAKCGLFDDALKVFYGIPVKSSVTWNAMISGYVQNGLYAEAVELGREMCRVGFVMDIVTLRILASASSALNMFDFCRNLHVYSIKIGLDTDSFVVAEIVRLLTKLGEVAYMGKLFNRVRKPDASLYSLLIFGYRLHGYRAEAVKLAEELLILDLNPKQGSLVNVLNLCLCKEEGRQIHARILKTGNEVYLSISNAIISMYTNFGQMVDADQAFSGMPVRDVVTWTAIIAGLVQNLHFEEALETFHAFRKTRIPLDQHSVVTIINACTGLRAIEKGKQIHVLALKLGFEFSDFFIASLIHLYAKCGYIESAARMFSYSSHDLIVTNIMLAGYCWNSEPGVALDLFGWGYRSGLVPDHFSLSTVLGACADMRSLEVGEQIHCRISKSGFEFSDCIIGNAIINMYIKSGSIASACKFFYSTTERNLNSYAMLMSSYIQSRGCSEAMQLFYQMQQSKICADPVAFARIVRGCFDVSKIDLGKQVHACIIKMGLVSDVYAGKAFVGMCATSRDMDGTNKSDELSDKDDVLCKAIVAGNSQNGNKDRMLGVFKFEKVKENYIKNTDVLNHCVTAASQMRNRYVPPHVVPSCLSFDMSVYTSRTDDGDHTRHRISDNRWNMHAKMPPGEVVFRNSLTFECSQNECRAMELFRVMQREKITQDHIICLVFFADFTHVSSVDEEINSFRSVRLLWSGEYERTLNFHG